MWKTIKDFIWPKKCINCNKAGTYLCIDCMATIDLIKKPEYFQFDKLKRLYVAVPYNNRLVQNLINLYKNYKDVGEDLANILITHLKLLDKEINWNDFVIYPLDLEISKYVSKEFKIPIKESGKNVLIVGLEFEGETFFKIAEELNAERVWGITIK